MGSNVIVTIIVIVYLLFMLWIGWYSSTKISTNTDFMVAGRLQPVRHEGDKNRYVPGGFGLHAHCPLQHPEHCIHPDVLLHIKSSRFLLPICYGTLLEEGVHSRHHCLPDCRNHRGSISGARFQGNAFRHQVQPAHHSGSGSSLHLLYHILTGHAA